MFNGSIGRPCRSQRFQVVLEGTISVEGKHGKTTGPQNSKEFLKPQILMHDV